MRAGQRVFSPFWRSARCGSALLDAALVLPILLSLMFGTVEYGHFFYWKHTLQGAAREGARTAITALSLTPKCSLVRSKIGPMLSVAQAS